MLNKIENIIKDKTFLSALIVGAITYLPVAMYAHISMDTYTAFVDRIQKETYLNFGKPLRFCIEYISKLLKFDAFSPYYTFIVSTLFFSLAIYFLVTIFDISNSIFKIVAGLSIVLPMFNDYFLYTHDTVIYAISYFITTYCCWLIIKKNKIIFPSMLILFSILIYIPFLQIPSSIFVLYLIKQIILNGKCPKYALNLAIRFFIILFFITILFLIIIKLFGSTSTINKNYLLSIFKIYAMPISWMFRNHLYINITFVQKISISIIYIIIFLSLIKPFLKLEFTNKFLFILLLISLPFAMNFIYIVNCGGTLRYVTSMIYLIIVPMVLLDNCVNINKFCFYALLSAIFIECFYLFYCEQVRIYQCKLIDDSIHSYCTEFVAKIKNLNGYHSDDKICFIKSRYEYQLNDLNDYYVPMNPLNIETWTNAMGSGYPNVFKQMIKMNGAYNIRYVDENTEKIINENDSYKNMPIYPNDGSIIKDNDVIIIRIN